MTLAGDVPRAIALAIRRERASTMPLRAQTPLATGGGLLAVPVRGGETRRAGGSTLAARRAARRAIRRLALAVTRATVILFPTHGGCRAVCVLAGTAHEHTAPPDRTTQSRAGALDRCGAALLARALQEPHAAEQSHASGGHQHPVEHPARRAPQRTRRREPQRRVQTFLRAGRLHRRQLHYVARSDERPRLLGRAPVVLRAMLRLEHAPREHGVAGVEPAQRQAGERLLRADHRAQGWSERDSSSVLELEQKVLPELAHRGRDRMPRERRGAPQPALAGEHPPAEALLPTNQHPPQHRRAHVELRAAAPERHAREQAPPPQRVRPPHEPPPNAPPPHRAPAQHRPREEERSGEGEGDGEKGHADARAPAGGSRVRGERAMGQRFRKP